MNYDYLINDDDTRRRVAQAIDYSLILNKDAVSLSYPAKMAAADAAIATICSILRGDKNA